MPDIREVLAALDPQDRRLYSQTRTRMRSAYLQALTEVVGIHAHDESDDALLDLIDIKIAILFDRSGRFDNSAGAIDTKRANDIEAGIETRIVATLSRGQRVLDETKEGWAVQ